MKGQEGAISHTSGPHPSGPHPSGPGERRQAILSHEVGTVLNGMLGMAELLDHSGLNGEQRNWLDAIRDSGIQLQRLVESLGCIHGSGGWVAGDAASFDGAELLEQVIRSHTPTALEKGNLLLLISDPQMPRRWRADPCAVRQLLDNLLSNALRHTSAGVVVLDVSATVARGSDSADLELRVTDTGCGIDASEMAAIFEPYRQGRSIGETGSRGLGLYICERIVDAWGGRIFVDSERGRGSQFRLRLPSVFRRCEWRQPGLRSALFETLSCELALRGPLFLSVQSVLAALGVESCEAGDSAAGESQGAAALRLRISEPTGALQGLTPRLLIEPLQAQPQQTQPAPRFLTAPILASTLAPALMAMALEWRQGLSLREKRG